MPEPEVDAGRLRQHEARGERPQGQRRQDLLHASPRPRRCSFQLEKKTPGRKVGGKCVKQTPKNKSKKRCPRFKKIGAKFNGPGKKGANTATLPNGKKLKPGTYRLTMTATDAAGNKTTKTTTFKVKKKKKKK